MKKIKIDRAIQERPATRKQTRNEKIRQSLTEHVDVQVIPAITDREGYEKPKLRVCAYCRVSTDMDTQALSYELQVQNYTDYIRGNDEWQFAGIYADRGISGTSLKHRDEFNRMIEDCKAGKIDLIITKAVTRFARIMEFWKMNGAGNDFIVVDDRRNAIPENRWPEIVRVLCERHMSIGADGFMVVKPPTCGGDYKMLFFNSDGSMGEMCGNGARCICRFGFENGLAGETQRVETTAGLVTGWRMGKRLYRIRLNDPCHLRLNGTAEADGITYGCAYVELGDPGIPHAAVPIAGLRDYDTAALLRLGRTLRHYPDFPKGANVNFYEIIGPDHVYERTYERGVEDFTYACGTGTGSVVTVLTLLGKVSGKHVRVDMTGGTLYVDAERNAAGRVTDLYLTGPTNVVCKGEITDENLVL